MLKIVETLQTVIDEAIDSIEWVYEKICDIEPLNNHLTEVLITDTEMYGCLNLDEAVQTMQRLYDNEKLRVCIPTQTTFTYKGMEYQLCLCLGDVVYKQQQLQCKYGIKHIIDKHSDEHGQEDSLTTLCSEKRLWDGIKLVNKAIELGVGFIDKQNPDRLVFYYNGLVYVICVANTNKELTYLHTLFKPKKSYFGKAFKSRYKKIDKN